MRMRPGIISQAFGIFWVVTCLDPTPLCSFLHSSCTSVTVLCWGETMKYSPLGVSCKPKWMCKGWAACAKVALQASVKSLLRDGYLQNGTHRFQSTVSFGTMHTFGCCSKNTLSTMRTMHKGIARLHYALVTSHQWFNFLFCFAFCLLFPPAPALDNMSQPKWG